MFNGVSLRDKNYA